jgi:hypothetical protein
MTIETLQLPMKTGDIVRLKKPFAPVQGKTGAFQYGIVAGVIKSDRQHPSSAAAEIILTLFDPAAEQVYTDETGAKALYSFYLDEIDPIQ